MSSSSTSRNARPRPYGRRSAIFFLVGSLGLLVWALTAGDDPGARLSLIGSVVALTIVSMSVRYTYRTIKEQRIATPTSQYNSISVRRSQGSSTTPEPYNKILHQLNSAVNNPSYLHSVLLPKLEEILAKKKVSEDSNRIALDLKRLDIISNVSRWGIDRMLYNRRKNSQLIVNLIQEIGRLP